MWGTEKPMRRLGETTASALSQSNVLWKTFPQANQLQKRWANGSDSTDDKRGLGHSMVIDTKMTRTTSFKDWADDVWINRI